MLAEWSDNDSVGNKDSHKEIRCLEFVLESDSVVFSSLGGWVREWCPKTGQLRELLMDDLTKAFRSRDRAYHAISLNGKHIASPMDGPTVLLLDCASGEEVKQLDVYNSNPECVAFSMTAICLLQGQTMARYGFGVWDSSRTEDGEHPTCIAEVKLEGHPQRVKLIRFSPDALRLACICEEVVLRHFTGRRPPGHRQHDRLLATHPLGHQNLLSTHPHWRWEQ